MIYRIYTEDLNRQEVVSIITKYYQGFTIFEAIRYWKLKKERSIVIELAVNGNYCFSHPNVKNICEEIKSLNKQESVLVVKISSESSFI